jgi:hypothetical protein
MANAAAMTNGHNANVMSHANDPSFNLKNLANLTKYN